MGGEVDIPQRDASDEFGDIRRFFRRGTNQYRQWTRRDPIMRRLVPGAIDYFESPTSPLLLSLQERGLEQLEGGPSDLLQLLTGAGEDLVTGGPSDLLDTLTSQAESDLALGGDISPEEEHQRQQQLLALRSRQGNLRGNQFAAEDLLNRDIYSRGRQAERRQFASGVEGLGQADIANRLGLASNIEGLAEGDESRRFGIASGVQGLTNQDIAQRFAIPQNVLSTGTQAYTSLTNPILGWLTDLASGNQSAAADESIAAANKSGGAAGGAMQGIGSIIGAIAPLLMFSDEELKEHIRKTGRKTAAGVPIKTFRYKGDKRRFEGVLAQDVEKKVPGAVGRAATGHRFIDLSKIDVPVREIKRAKAREIGSLLLTEA